MAEQGTGRTCSCEKVLGMQPKLCSPKPGQLGTLTCNRENGIPAINTMNPKNDLEAII